jgi:hypothetical protein
MNNDLIQNRMAVYGHNFGVLTGNAPDAFRMALLDLSNA